MQLIVNVSDAKISRDPDAVITTYSLGSCIGVTLYDPALKVGGMLHYQLPAASIDTERAKANPMMYADTGMKAVLEEVEALGGQRRRLKVKIAGAAQMFDDNNVFNIGKRNHAAIRKILWQHGLFLDGEDCGGSSPRTLSLRLADGSVTVKTGGMTKPL